MLAKLNLQKNQTAASDNSHRSGNYSARRQAKSYNKSIHFYKSIFEYLSLNEICNLRLLSQHVKHLIDSNQCVSQLHFIREIKQMKMQIRSCTLLQPFIQQRNGQMCFKQLGPKHALNSKLSRMIIQIHDKQVKANAFSKWREYHLY